MSHLISLVSAHAIAVLSVVAAAVNITGIVPQLLTMLRARSSAGQSPLGWTLGATCSGSLLIVNLVGYHAVVLAAGNLVSLTGSLTAAALAMHFRSGAESAPEEAVAELHTREFEVLVDAVLVEHYRRTGETALALDV